jgi:uncharacterized repeat protein (TIGR03837 family)
MSQPRSWDLFCRVVDNYGDVGVCWRLARALAGRPGASVRVWIDDLASLRMLVPGVELDTAVQRLSGIDVHRWTADFPTVDPAEVCVEGFGSGVPERYVEAMAARRPSALWIVLEYLSAEPWVREHHGLASPHPRFPVPRYFFFPGFERGTGGLLREAGLLQRREAYDMAARRRYWDDMGYGPPPEGATVVSMFAYPHAPLAPLLDHWAHGGGSWIVSIPVGELALRAVEWFGLKDRRAGLRAARGGLEVRIVPFVPQERYDEALWSADCAFVRGEDSFVRAQWAKMPFVWHIYPQDERAHWRKLDAFLALYCAGMPDHAAEAVQGVWRAWNEVGAAPATVGAAWDRYWDSASVLRAHAVRWADQLRETGELAENLAEFCRDKLK